MFALHSYSQDEIRIENGRDYMPSSVPSFMHSLHAENDFVVAFRTFFSKEAASGSDYFILTGRSKQLSAYRYSDANAGLSCLNLSSTSVDMIWKTVQQNQLFSIRDEKDIPNFCAKKYDIYDSYTYEFTILSKGRMKVLSYYNPEYYIEACYGISERQNIINLVSVLDLLVPKF
jgi:hypothetical protein